MHFSAYPLLATAAIITVGQALSITLNVNVDNKIQMMDGFGVSQALRKALNIERLPAQESAEVLDLLISQTIGAGLSIYRNGLGSSPDSSNGQMNSIQPLDPGGLDATPEYVWDGIDSGQVWLAKQAYDRGVRTFYGNPWSAPGYMKTNGFDSGADARLCDGITGTARTGDERMPGI